MGTFIAKMLKAAFLLSLVLLSAQAKTRKGPFPAKVWEKLRNEPLVDEDESKIVGGTDVEDLSERPYQIVMMRSGSLRCGGSIIGDNTVLTAAHCCDGVSASSISIRAGTLEHAKGGVVYDVTQLIMHEDYIGASIGNDICLLITSKTINAPGTAKATLPTGPMEFSPGDEFVVSGWGTTSSGGSISATLKQVTVPFVSDAECDSNYSAYGVHVGIVSWGVGCARRGYPGVYGQTDAFISW